MKDDVAKQLKVLRVVRIEALRLVAIIRSVTLFLKSLNDYKHFILKTTLKKIYKTFGDPVARILEVRPRNPPAY